MTSDPIQILLDSFREETARGVSSRADFERLKGRFLGRDKGLVPELFSKLKGLPPGERAAFGARANAAKTEIEEGVRRLGAEIEGREAASRDRASGRGRDPAGARHADRRAPPDHGRSPADRGRLSAARLLDRRWPGGRDRFFQLRGAELSAGPSGPRHAGHAARFGPQGRLAACCCARTPRRSRSARCGGTARRFASSCPAGSIGRTRSTRRTHPSFTRSKGLSSTGASRWPT